MLNAAITLSLFAPIAGVVGLTGRVGTATSIAEVLFCGFRVLLVLGLPARRRVAL